MVLDYFDSPSDVEDYTTTSHVVYANASLQATERLTLTLDGWVALTESGFDPFELGDLDEAPAQWDNDFSVISDYSDLEYTQVEATLGADYRLSRSTALQGSLTWMDLTDDQPYVYGDVSGSALYTQLGMRTRF